MDDFWDDEDDDFVLRQAQFSEPSWWNLAGAGIRYVESIFGDTAILFHRLSDMTLSRHIEISDKKKFVEEASRDIETIVVQEKDSL